MESRNNLLSASSPPVAEPSLQIPSSRLPKEEKQRALFEWNNTQKGQPPVCLHELIEAQARRTPDSIAVADAQQELTYSEVNGRANQLARYLRKLGVGPEVLVGIALERSAELLVALLGILKAGGAYVPLDPEFPRERLGFMMKDSGLRVILTQKSLLEKLPGVVEPRTCLDAEWGLIAEEGNEDFPSGASPDNLVYVIYTSGSTGRPKGVEITHRSLTNLVWWHGEAFEVTARDRATLLTSPSFDAAVWELWPYLSAGAKVLVPGDTTRLSPDLLRDWLIANRITIGFFPTSLAEQLIALEWPGSTSLRIMLTGADTLHHYPSQTLPFALVNNYGPTEATVVTTSGRVPVDGRAGSLPSIGRPIANAEAHILDERLQRVADGETGELYIGGPGLARGYRNHPELTAEKFIPNFFSDQPGARLYKTGDLTRSRSDGNIEFLGRVDSQVKIRGYRVETCEVEALLAVHPAVQAGVVVAREDQLGERRLIAYIVPRAGQSILPEELRRFLKNYVPAYMLPARFEFLEALPLTLSGKVDRQSLPAPGTSRPAESDASLQPGTEMERVLERIFAAVLGLERVGIDEDFLDLGGDSLRALELVRQIEQSFRRRISLAALYQAPSVRELAAFLSSHRSTYEVLAALPIQPSGSHPPFFCSGAGPLTQLLAQRLGPDQPFLGLVFEEAETKAIRIPFSMEDLAAILLRKLREKQPTGPYFLGGWCWDGILAYEMAQQLRASGEEVALLLLIDSSLPLRARRKLYAHNLSAKISGLTEDLAWHFSQIRKQGPKYFLKLGWRKLAELNTYAHYSIYRCCLRMGISIAGYMREWGYLDLFAIRDYLPQPYGGRVVLIRGRSPLQMPDADDGGWSALAKGELQVRFLPFVLNRELFHEPRVTAAASLLNEVLQQAQARTSPGATAVRAGAGPEPAD